MKKKIILPLLVIFTSLVSCENDPSKKYIVRLYDLSSSTSSEYHESSSIKVKEGELLKISNPSRKDFQKFVGWTKDKEHTQFLDFNKPITEDINLYADYSKKDERVLYLDYDDGISRWKVHKIGDEINQDQIPVTPDPQYELKNWCYDKLYNFPVSFPIKIEEDDQYIYALYENRKFGVTYNFNGGLFPTFVVKKQVNYGECAPIETPTGKEGTKFICWCKDKELTAEYDFSTKVYNDIELWGKWENYLIHDGSWYSFKQKGKISKGTPFKFIATRDSLNNFAYFGMSNKAGTTPYFDVGYNDSSKTINVTKVYKNEEKEENALKFGQGSEMWQYDNELIAFNRSNFKEGDRLIIKCNITKDLSSGLWAYVGSYNN